MEGSTVMKKDGPKLRKKEFYLTALAQNRIADEELKEQPDSRDQLDDV